MESYELLTGNGLLYIAPVGESFPDVDADPAGNWTSLGETQGGISLVASQSITQLRVDQYGGPIKAVRETEDVKIETTLAKATLENMAEVLGLSVTDTAPGASDIGTREVDLYRGNTVATYALLFRGEKMSPYGTTYPGQFQLPVGYFDGDLTLALQRAENMQVAVSFVALVDPDASSEADSFGKLIVQDAAATG